MTPVCSPIRIVATNNGFLRRLNSMESFNMAAKNYVEASTEASRIIFSYSPDP
jgi:hypothetical protein